MRVFFTLGLVLSVFCMLMSSCGTDPRPMDPPSAPSDPNGGPISYAQVDDNVRHDSLLIQTTFDLQDGTFIMVASHVAEKFEGLRLVRYRLLADSAADVIAVSAPGYDSWTMLPSFFRTEGMTNEHLVLANFGEKESWGQKFMRLGDGFIDLGFLDVAFPERIVEDDVLVLKRRNIAPYTRIRVRGDTTFITFTTDSVYLYEDLDNHFDIVLPAGQVHYTLDKSNGLQLWVNGAHGEVPMPPA